MGLSFLQSQLPMAHRSASVATLRQAPAPPVLPRDRSLWSLHPIPRLGIRAAPSRSKLLPFRAARQAARTSSYPAGPTNPPPTINAMELLARVILTPESPETSPPRTARLLSAILNLTV